MIGDQSLDAFLYKLLYEYVYNPLIALMLALREDQPS